MRRYKFLFLLYLIFIFLFLYSCGQPSLDCYEFKEEVVESIEFNPDLKNTFEYLFLNSDGTILVKNIDQNDKSIYFDENMVLTFYHRFGTENWYISIETNDKKSLIYLSEVGGFELENIEKAFIDLELEMLPNAEGVIYPLNNGNVIIGIDYFGLVKIFEIDPMKKELINANEFSNLKDEGIGFSICTITDENTVFCNSSKGELIFYNNYTGEIEKKEYIPGFFEGIGTFGTSTFKNYDGYWYTCNSRGIFRSKEGKSEWECLIDASKTKALSSKNNVIIKDLVIFSDSEIYVYIYSEYDEIESKVTSSIVKLELFE